jgi:hypothetical protein
MEVLEMGLLVGVGDFFTRPIRFGYYRKRGELLLFESKNMDPEWK